MTHLDETEKARLTQVEQDLIRLKAELHERARERHRLTMRARQRALRAEK